MSVYDPDLSGMDWSYYSSTYQRTVFQYAQKLLFDVPVFQNDRFEISLLGGTKLTYGVDYIVYADDINIDAMSVCKNINLSFDKVLLKSVTMIVNVQEPFRVQVKFNQLFADAVNYAQINQAQEIEVTPVLIANMVEQITYLQQMYIDKAGEYSAQSAGVKLALNEYPNGDNDENLIPNEQHDIDTLNNKCLIRPIYGAFFKNSVHIKNALSGVDLDVGVDYIILDLDISRTKATANPSGVYRLIKIVKDIVGPVDIDYRAYGGEADVASIRRMQDRVHIVEEYLGNTSYITPNTLPADPTVISIRNKLQEIEGTMRLLLQNGLPSYGDVSSGNAILKKLTAQDTGLHWWSIATLYRVDGSVDDILSDVFKFRLKSVMTKLMFECSVAVNVNGSTHERLSVICNNSNIPSDTLLKYSPRLRIIEVSAGGVYSGVVLQLGMKLGSILQETIDIEDMSGRESCWKLTSFSANSVPPEDTGILMPNGTSIFSYGESAALVDAAVIPFKEGLNLLLTEANIPVQLGNLSFGTFGNTENTEMVIQSIDPLDFKSAKNFGISVVFNIGEIDERLIDFIIPITVKDSATKYWSGNDQVVLGDITYQIHVEVKYNTTDYSVIFKISASDQVNTLNVSAVKLLF